MQGFEVLASLISRLQPYLRPVTDRPVVTLALIGITHRVTLLFQLRGFVDGLVSQQPTFLVFQLLPLENYRNHFWRSLWLLQQSPPINHFIMKAVVTMAPNPHIMALLLCELNGALSIGTACLLYRLVQRISGSPIIGFCLAVWLLLSTDVLVLEYAFLGQIFYEDLGMFWVACCCVLMVGLDRREGGSAERRAGLLGLTASLAALTRSSLSYFPFALLLYGLARWRPRVAITFLAPVMVLSLGWAAKNAIVYGKFSVETSSWGGLNAERGLDWTKQRPLLCQDIAQSPPGTYPDWFLRINRTCPVAFSDASETNATSQTQSLDAAAQASLGGIASFWNSRALADEARQYKRAIEHFVLDHPYLAWIRFKAGYKVLWQRMADYGIMYRDPIYVVAADRPFPGLLSRFFGEERSNMLTLAHGWRAENQPESWGTISLAPLDAISILALHMIFPLLLLIDGLRWLQRRPAFLPRGTAALASVTAYGLIMFSAFDIGENMRFRLAIEPAIIALTAACLAGIWRAVVTAWVCGIRRSTS